jgi:hypothetical protein
LSPSFDISQSVARFRESPTFYLFFSYGSAFKEPFGEEDRAMSSKFKPP